VELSVRRQVRSRDVTHLLKHDVERLISWRSIHSIPNDSRTLIHQNSSIDSRPQTLRIGHQYLRSLFFTSLGDPLEIQKRQSFILVTRACD
jgi:hypothetical protein